MENQLIGGAILFLDPLDKHFDMKMLESPDLKGSKVLIVDYGGQYTHLISRRLRELGAFTLILPFQQVKDADLNEYSALVLSGSHLSVEDLDNKHVDDIRKVLYDFSKPILGICFGLQLISYALGGKVSRNCGEYGETKVKVLSSREIFEGWSNEETVWMSHGDCVSEMPEGASLLAVSENGYVAAIKLELKGKLVYGVQFHPEVYHTPKGSILLDNFLKIAGVEKKWTAEMYLNSAIEELREKAKEEGKALVAVSGGVDSTVSAALAKRAFGERLITVFIDHGLLREGEREEVEKALKEMGLNPIVIDASERFLKKLEGTSDCEVRRKIIGEEFASVFSEIIEKERIRFFIQGTTYPDVVESGGTKVAAVIKTHHNVGGLPEWFKGKVEVIEPLKLLYKDEVRKLARLLNVPENIVSRHPFPGPGLAVRVIGTFTRQKLEIARKASKIVEDTLKKHGLYGKVWQAFAVVGDDKWVGVKGDARTHGFIVTIRIVESSDGMTADYVKIPFEVLEEISKKISSSINEVVMVTYALSSKPPSTIEPC